MIATNHVARVEATICSSADQVWKALTDPEMIKHYMFGTTVISDWKEGSKIIWEGEWQGKHYKDKGKILELIPMKRLQYSHFSPLEGKDDVPENYHIVTIDLEKKDGATAILLKQDNNHTEEGKRHSEKNWKLMLDSMRKLLERSNVA